MLNAESAEEPAQLLLDKVAIDSILALGSEFFTKILAAFEDSWEEDWLRLQECVAAEDFQAARTAAHRMKSSSANLGAAGLSALCATIEDSARERQILAVAAGVAALDDAFERYSKELRAIAEKGEVS